MLTDRAKESLTELKLNFLAIASFLLSNFHLVGLAICQNIPLIHGQLAICDAGLDFPT